MAEDCLQYIFRERAEAVRAAKARNDRQSLESRAVARVHHDFRRSLMDGVGPRIIAECKHASPSAGILVEDYRPADIARGYVTAGAAAVSVLTEPLHFLGSADDLMAVRRAVDCPVLCKDFLCDAYQVLEAAAWGADVVLIILAAVDEALGQDLYRAARERGLDVLVEAHTAAEVERALAWKDAVVGVNSRDLKTLVTNLSVALELAPMIPAGRLAVAESGIRTADDIRRLMDAGYRGFLIGESFLRRVDPGSALHGLIHAVRG